MNFEDELQSGLHRAGDTISVPDAGAAAIERRARQRSTRNRAAVGLGAFALVAGAIGGTIAFTGGDSDTVDTAIGAPASGDGDAALSPAATQDEATADAASSSRRPGVPGDVVFGDVPLDWEQLDVGRTPQLGDIRIAGDTIISRNQSGWLSVSTDVRTWTDLPIPDSVASADRLGGIAGWVNAFDARGDVIVAAVEIFDETNLLDEEEAIARDEAAAAGLVEAPPIIDPCSNGRSGSRTVIVRSNDRGATWTTHELQTVAPEGRFYSGGAVPWVATDGTDVVAAQEQYLSLNVECVLQEAGIDVTGVHASGGGYGWNDAGVQIFAGFDGTEEEAVEEKVLAEYPWSELGLNDAEFRAATTDLENGDQTKVSRIDASGVVSDVALAGYIGNVFGLDGEFLATRWDQGAQMLLRSVDGGVTWSEAPFQGFIRSVQGDQVLRQSDDGRSMSVSEDGGRTWTDLGAPAGTWVQGIAVLGDVAIALGEDATFGGTVHPPEEEFGPFEQTGTVGGYTITITTDQSEMVLQMVDDATGEVVVRGVAPIEMLAEAQGTVTDLGFMRIDADGNVTFVDADGVDIATFTEAEMDDAFNDGDLSSGSGASAGSTASGSAVVPAGPLTRVETGSSFEAPAAPVEPPVSCEEGGCDDVVVDSIDGSDGFVQPDVLVSYRDASGSWVSQKVSDLVGSAHWAQTVFSFQGAFYVVLEPNVEFPEEPARDATREEEAAFDEAQAFPRPVILVGHPRG